MAEGDCTDDIEFAVPCDPVKGPSWDCSGQTLLQQRYAAEYAKINGVTAQYYVQIDQFERQAPGPQGTGMQYDMLYGEPAIPVLPGSDDRVEEVWNFRDPIPVSIIVTDRSSEREPGERGASKTTTYTLAMPVYSLLSGGCVDRLEGKDFSVGIKDIARVGDVIFLGGNYNAWLDVERTSRQGYITPDMEHTWVEVEGVKRSKYVPSRKENLPDREKYPSDNHADDAAETGLPYRPPEDHVNDPLRPWD